MPDPPAPVLGELGAKGHAPNTSGIRVFSVGKSLKIEPFKIPENPLEIGRAGKNGSKILKTKHHISRLQKSKTALAPLRSMVAKKSRNSLATYQKQRQWSETMITRS